MFPANDLSKSTGDTFVSFVAAASKRQAKSHDYEIETRKRMPFFPAWVIRANLEEIHTVAETKKKREKKKGLLDRIVANRNRALIDSVTVASDVDRVYTSLHLKNGRSIKFVTDHPCAAEFQIKEILRSLLDGSAKLWLKDSCDELLFEDKYAAVQLYSTEGMKLFSVKRLIMKGLIVNDAKDCFIDQQDYNTYANFFSKIDDLLPASHPLKLDLRSILDRRF